MDLRTARDRARKSISGESLSGKRLFGKSRSRKGLSEKGAALRGPRRWLAALCGAGVTLLVFFLYLMTLAPGVMYYARPNLLDAATLQVHAITLGITHPTGYPTWVMLTHLFTYLPFGNPAYLTNLSSAVYSSAAVAALYAAGLLLTRRVAAAAVGALGFGLGATFWSQAVIAEIYNLNALFVALFFSVMLLWRDRLRQDCLRRDRARSSKHADRYLLAAAFIAGLSLTNHMTSAAAILGGVAFVWLVEPSRLRDSGLAVRAAGLFVLGLAPYIHLPVRARMGAPLQEGDPDSIGAFIKHVSGSEVSGTLFGKEIWEVPDAWACICRACPRSSAGRCSLSERPGSRPL